MNLQPAKRALSISCAISILALLACGEKPATSTSPSVLINNALRLPREPLDQQAFQNVVADIWAWMSAPNRGRDHVFSAATDESISRLLATPAFRDLSINIKLHALDVALQMGVVEFRTPADVTRNIKYWFKAPETRPTDTFLPREIPRPPRATPNWSIIGVAYRAVWACLPKAAWQSDVPIEGAMPFGSGWQPGNATFSYSGSMDFKTCTTREVERDPTSAGSTQAPPWRHDLDPYKGDARRFIEDMLIATLRDQQCAGKGADDCVLVSALLTQLAPGRAETVDVLKRVDPLVRVDERLDVPASPRSRPNPPFSHPWESYLKSIFRRAAFLGAKLDSQVAAPGAWPPDAWLETTREIAALDRRAGERRFFEGQSSVYSVDRGGNPLSPLNALERALTRTTDASARLRERLLEQARLNAKASDCRPPGSDGYIYTGLNQLPGVEFRVARLLAGDETNCGGPLRAFKHSKQKQEWAVEAEARAAAKIVALIGRTELSFAHEEALDWYVQSNEVCSYVGETRAKRGPGPFCSPWISEPQAVRKHLYNTKLTLTRAESFRSTKLKLANLDPKSGESIELPRERIVDLLTKRAPQAKDAMAGVLAEIQKYRGSLIGAVVFHRADHAKQLVLVETSSSDAEQWKLTPWPAYLGREQVALVIDRTTVKPLFIPSRFSYRNDDGTVFAVSDLDRDGNLEVWLRGTFGECDEEDSKPGIDCAIEVLYMGEEFGKALSWFVRDSGPK